MLGAFLLGAIALIGLIAVFSAHDGLRRFRPALAIVGFVLLLGTAGCGGAVPDNGSGTPAGSRTASVTMTNTANNSVVTFNFTLSVN